MKFGIKLQESLVEMPVFIFKCRNKHRIEVQLKLIETRPIICSACGERLYREYSPPAIKFIGSGFYVNDSKGEME